MKFTTILLFPVYLLLFPFVFMLAILFIIYELSFWATGRTTNLFVPPPYGDDYSHHYEYGIYDDNKPKQDTHNYE